MKLSKKEDVKRNMNYKKYKYEEKRPYCLHDIHINKIVTNKDYVEIYFNDKILNEDVKLKKIIINDVDFDLAYICIQSQNDKEGRYNGEKINIRDFETKYKNSDIEIVDEYYGYNSVEYRGYIYNKTENIKEIIIEIGYYTGTIDYYFK